MNELDSEIQLIKERNKRVETDKAWEKSWTRRLFISFITYLVAVIWLYMINENAIWLKATIPVFGYILSTITIPQLKKVWINKIY